jgi:hypothetical protein
MSACDTVGVSSGSTPTSAADGESGSGSSSGGTGTSTVQSPPPAEALSLSGTPATTASVGQMYTFQPGTSSSLAGTPAFSISNKPSWASFNDTTGQLTGTPTAASVGTTSGIVITATQAGVTASLPAFSITVGAPTTTGPGAPTISGTPPSTAPVGKLYSFTPTTTRPAGAPALSFAISGKPSWATFSSTTGQLSGTPEVANAGTYAGIRISVSDGETPAASLPSFSITVTQTGTAPVLSGVPATQAMVGNLYAFQPGVANPSGGTVTFSIANLPRWAQFSTTTGRLTGTPAAANTGMYANVVISARNAYGSASLPTFSIRVAAQPPTKSAPTISGSPSTSATVGKAYSFQPSATEPAGAGALVFSISGKPSWASFSSSTGLLSGTPAAANVGTFGGIVISVSDGQASASLPAFSIAVAGLPPPTISGTPATQVTVGSSYSFQPSATAPAGAGPLVFSITNKPAWASFSTSTGLVSGQPTSGNVGTTSGIVISVSDGEASAALPAFAIKVTASGPTISGTPPTKVEAGASYSFQPSVSDPAGGKLTYTITSLPAWATFSSTSGALTGKPAAANVGTTSGIVISVSDGTNSASLPAFAITVESGPSISGSPATSVSVGTAYNFTPSASDAAGGTLSFSITNKPSWATFSIATGQLTGTPTAANVGTTSGIVISVSDGTATASLPGFAIAVTQSSTATLSWTAPTTNTNGTALTDLSGYIVSYGTSPTALTNAVTISNAATTSYSFAGLAAGTWYVSIVATASDGTQSAATAPVSFVVN